MGSWAMENERRYDVEAVKARLYAYREMSRDIENQNERLERINVKLIGVGAQSITDMPKSPSHTDDRTVELIQQKMELEEEIREVVEKRRAERVFFESVIKCLRRSDERAVIRVRYIDGANWDEVVDVLFGGKEDLLEREDIYLRRVYKLHGQALLSMAKYIEENGTGRSGTGG